MVVTQTPINIGKSYQNRDIFIYEYLVDKPKFNVLITGTVHGIEYPGGQAVIRLMEDIEANPSFYSDLNIVVLPFWNVDGIANNTYNGAQEFSINYSAICAITPEYRRLWEYLINNQYYPDFYIDNHNLDRWNRGTSYNLYNSVPRLAYRENSVIAMNTSSLFRHKMGWNEWTDMIKYVNDNGAQGYVYNKFWNLNDYYNLAYVIGYDIAENNSFFAARFDCLSFIIEGVAPADYTNYNNPEYEATKQSQFLSNKYMIDWARKKHPELVTSKCVPPYVGERIPINQTPVWELFPDRVQVENDATEASVYLWSTYTRWRYSNDDLAKEWTTAPLAYAIHNTDEEDVVTFVKYYGFEWSQGQAGDSYDTEVFHCIAADAWDDREGDIPMQYPQVNRNGYYVSSTRTNFSNYTIFPVQQFGGDALIHLLEPMSEANMSAYQSLFPTLNLRANDDFPILRLIRKR